MVSIQYINMKPVRSTGHKEIWLTAKYNNLEKEQNSCTIWSIELSWHCPNDHPDISQTLMTSVITCTLPLPMAHYSCWSSAIISIICCKVVINSSSLSEAEVLLIFLGELLIAGVGACSWKRLDRMILVIPSMFLAPDVPSSWKRGQIPAKYCPHGPP